MDNEALSVEGTEEVTAPESAKEQEAAAPAAETEAGANEQEVAEPAEPSENGTSTQSPQERHAQAEQRRRRENDEREQALRQEYESKFQKQKDAFYAGMKKVNPYTNQLITTEAEYLAYEAESRRREREQEFKKAGINPETIEQMINEHPDVRAAKAAAEDARASKERYDRLAKQQVIKDELRKISKLDPNIRTPQDLMNHPRYGEIKQLVAEHNHSIAEAFELATQKDKDAENQMHSRANAAAVSNSKGHMVASSTSGNQADEYTVPPETLRAYRKAYPGLPDAELRKKFARVQKNKKGNR